MRIPKRFFWLPILIAGVSWLAACRHSASSASDESDQTEPPTEVEVAKLEKKTLSEPVTAYGSVLAQPARINVVAAAFETRVKHILVAPGQVVRKGDPLAEIEPSAAALLQYQQARNAADSAKRDLDQTRSRFDLKLATNQDLGQAEKEARDADLELSSLEQSGLGGDNQLRAALDGIVAKVDVQNGQLVPLGGAIVETVAADDIEVKLGVEPEDLSILKEGAPVEITPVQGGSAAAIEGAIRLVTHRTDPDTRLVDVYVALPPGSGLLLDSYVAGAFNRTANDALVAPRAAIVSDEDGTCVFTVENGKAVRCPVALGIEQDEGIQVTGSGLTEGQQVVTVGSHELEDGAAVVLPGAK